MAESAFKNEIAKRFKGSDYKFCETIQIRRKKSTKNIILEQIQKIKKFYNNTTESEVILISCEYNIYNILQGYIRISDKIHDKYISSLSYECKRLNNRVKIKNTDTNVGIRSKVYPNRRTIGILQLFFEKLCRIGALTGYKLITEIPLRICQLVYINPYPL
ncbi:hypothetical protein RhiirC2_798331 [Rhizophagus irregularis]|uniref:Uncharacterized protein n=1 Tax=Rhizophagus irregularis TaxID=588596 RepID=A0A2N1M6P1_9GLOM|nr:hypothetical protein RhiirC2_798331 [Rhizophagus irregularis]